MQPIPYKLHKALITNGRRLLTVARKLDKNPDATPAQLESHLMSMWRWTGFSVNLEVDEALKSDIAALYQSLLERFLATIPREQA